MTLTGTLTIHRTYYLQDEVLGRFQRLGHGRAEVFLDRLHAAIMRKVG